MKPWIVVLIIGLLWKPIFFLHPLPSREPPKPETNLSNPPFTPIKIEGILRLVGNEPFPQLGLVERQNRIYDLEVDSKEQIRSYIGSPVKVEGLLVRKRILLADDRELPEEWSIVQYRWEPLPNESIPPVAHPK
jgi:hypothetical protein